MSLPISILTKPSCLSSPVLSPTNVYVGSDPGGNLISKPGSEYSDAGATVADNIDTGLEVVATSTVDTSKPGEYAVAYNVSDAEGNKAAEATRKVTVVDTTDLRRFRSFVTFRFMCNKLALPCGHSDRVPL